MLSVKSIFARFKNEAAGEAAYIAARQTAAMPKLKKKYEQIVERLSKEAYEALSGITPQPSESRIRRDSGVGKLTYVQKDLRWGGGAMHVSCHLAHTPFADLFISMVSAHAVAGEIYKKLAATGLTNFDVYIEASSRRVGNYNSDTCEGAKYNLYFYVRVYEDKIPEEEIRVYFRDDYADELNNFHSRGWRLSKVKSIAELGFDDILGKNDL